MCRPFCCQKQRKGRLTRSPVGCVRHVEGISNRQREAVFANCFLSDTCILKDVPIIHLDCSALHLESSRSDRPVSLMLSSFHFWFRPVQAYTRHILPFVDWGASLVRGNSTLIWRTATPSVWFCRRKNGILHNFNEMTSHLLSGRNPEVKLFDSWQIEAPRFRDADPISHYSWTERNENGNGTLVMAGLVGKAVVRAFMTWLLEDRTGM